MIQDPSHQPLLCKTEAYMLLLVLTIIVTVIVFNQKVLQSLLRKCRIGEFTKEFTSYASLEHHFYCIILDIVDLLGSYKKGLRLLRGGKRRLSLDFYSSKF